MVCPIYRRCLLTTAANGVSAVQDFRTWNTIFPRQAKDLLKAADLQVAVFEDLTAQSVQRLMRLNDAGMNFGVKAAV